MSTFGKKLLTLLIIFSASISIQAQQRGFISGLITDSQTGDPLIGASILVQGTSLGGATDVEGRYRINNIPAGDIILIVSSIGYERSQFSAKIIARQRTVLDIEITPIVGELDEIRVVGNRKSQLDAINQKRQSENLREVLTSDDLGRLPDINVAEATQRVAGVALETDKGEGRFVSIRGVQPALNNVTMNNQSNLASTAGSRATALDLLPTEIISSIEVVKAVTPDMEGNAVGGTVNINTISAFEKTKPFMFFSVDGLLHERQNTDGFGDVDLPFRLSATAGQRFGKDQNLGVVLSTNYFKRDFTVSVIDPDEWIYETQDGQGYFLPNENEIQLEDNERTRFGINSDIEYRFTPDNSVYLKTLYTRTREIALNSEFELTFEGDLDIVNENRGTWSAGSMELDLSRGDETENLYSFIAGTKNRFGDLTTDVYTSYSYGSSEFYDPDGTFENPGDTEDQIPLQYDLSNFFFDVTTPNSAFASREDIMLLRSVNLNRGDIIENNFEVSADLTYDLFLGEVPGYIKAGGRFRDRDIDVDRRRLEYALDYADIEATNPYTVAQFALNPWAPEQGGQQPFHHGSAQQFADFVSNPANMSQTDRIVLDEADTFYEQYENDFENEETVTAAYLMGSFNFSRFNILGGLRVEHTTTSSFSYLLAENADLDDRDALNVDEITDDNSYTSFLPSIHLKANLTDQLVARASWTNTIGRPDFARLSATSEFEFEETLTPDVYEGALQEANADLKPFESMNYDLSLSYYINSGGLISVGGFYKDVENQIFSDERQLDNTTFRGLFFEELVIESQRNADNASLYGIEILYDQAFTFLPSPLNGFGTSINLAFIDSEIELPSRPGEKLPLFRQPSEVYNGIIYYQKNGIEVRFAGSHRSKMLLNAAGVVSFEDEILAGASVSDFDRWEDARTTFDLLAGYTLPNNNIRITGQIRNLTNESEQSYQGISSRLDRHQLTGRTFFMAVNFSF